MPFCSCRPPLPYFVSGVPGQTYASAVAKLSQRSHVVRSLRAYVILCTIKIKWIICFQKLHFLVCHRDQGAAQSKFLEISPLLQRNYSKIDCKSIFSGWQKASSLLPSGGICHSMPPHGYGPVEEKDINKHLDTFLSFPDEATPYNVRIILVSKQ